MTIDHDYLPFKLQPRFLYPEILFLCIAASFFIVSWFPSIFSILIYEKVLQSAARASLFLNITGVIVFFLYKIIKDELRRFTIIFTADQLVIKGPIKPKAVGFSGIIGIKYIRVPMIRGFLRINTADSSFRIPLFMEHPQAFITALKARLNEQVKFSANMIDSRFNDDMMVIQDSYQRSLKAFYPLVMISLVMFSFNILVAAGFWNLYLIPTLLFGMTGLFFPSAAYCIADIKISRSVRNMLKSDAAEIHNSALEYLYCGFLTFLAYLFVGIIYKVIILWHS